MLIPIVKVKDAPMGAPGYIKLTDTIVLECECVGFSNEKSIVERVSKRSCRQNPEHAVTTVTKIKL